MEGQNGYGDPGQPPRFSAGSLIDDDGLPAWLSAPDGQPAQAGRGPQPPTPPAPAPPWQQRRADPYQQDIAAQRTVRQPTVGPAGPAAPQFPFPQAQYQQPPAPQPPYPAPTSYPPQPGYAAPPPPYSPPPNYPPQPGYGAPPPPQPNYGGNPAYQQPPQYQQPPAPPNVNAFPPIDQAGAGYRAPQPGGMNSYAAANPQALPHWLSGGQPGIAATPRSPVPSGMQARSLVDDRALPKWLRDQPESAGASNMSEWIGSSAAQEPMPQVLSDAYAQAPAARAPQQPYAAPQQPYAAPQQPYAAPAYAAPQPYDEPGGQPGWQNAANEEPLPPGAGFAASDLIDPNSLPDWVTQRAPAPQTFSSTQGWSSAAPEAPDMESALRTPAQGYGDGFDDATGGAQAVGVEMDWEDDAWDDGGPKDGDQTGYGTAAHTGYGAAARAPRGLPLAPDELPPWLQGNGGEQPSAGHNPWMAPSQPKGYGGGWEERGGWDESSAQQAATGWRNESQGWDARHDTRGEGGWDDNQGYGDPRDDWREQRAAAPRWEESEQGYSAPYSAQSADYYQPGRRRRSGGYDQRGHDQRGHDQRGYDDGYGRDEMDYDEGDDDDGRGRGFLGFLRRGRR
jgi:hypothetical protein